MARYTHEEIRQARSVFGVAAGGAVHPLAAGNGTFTLPSKEGPQEQANTESEKKVRVNSRTHPELYQAYNGFRRRAKRKTGYYRAFAREFPSLEYWIQYWTDLGWEAGQHEIYLLSHSDPPVKRNMALRDRTEKQKQASQNFSSNVPELISCGDVSYTAQQWADYFDIPRNTFNTARRRAKKEGVEEQWLQACVDANTYLTLSQILRGNGARCGRAPEVLTYCKKQWTRQQWADHLQVSNVDTFNSTLKNCENSGVAEAWLQMCLDEGKQVHLTPQVKTKLAVITATVQPAANTPKAKPHTPHKNAEKAKSPQRYTTTAIPDINEPEPATDTRGVCADCTEWDTCPVRLTMVQLFEGKVLTRCPIPQIKQEPEETAIWERSPQLYAEQWQCSRCRTVFPMPKPDINPARFNYNYCPACRAAMIEEE